MIFKFFFAIGWYLQLWFDSIAHALKQIREHMKRWDIVNSHKF